MSTALKKGILLCGIAALGFHFAMLLINANPFSAPKGRLHYWSDYYCYPYFLQTWNLFAPPPQCNYKLLVRYGHNGFQQEDVFGEIVAAHQSNRLKGYEQLLLAFTTGIHYFEKKALAAGSLQGLVDNDPDFAILEHMTANYLDDKCGGPVENLKLTLVVTDEPSGRQRVYYSP